VSNINYTIAESDHDLYGILKLQRENLATEISREEALEHGFVTVEHNFALLKRMNSPYPHIIAKDGEEVIGYTLVMSRDLRDEIPVLAPMFEQIDNIIFNAKMLKDTRYIVMGQVCIAKRYRGQGVFGGLYEEMAKRMAVDFDYILTEVSQRNQRSLRAHQKVEFETIREYHADDGEVWVIVLWGMKGER
jgi:ribosomal protein S18 acetylase RimI-like enzyme